MFLGIFVPLLFYCPWVEEDYPGAVEKGPFSTAPLQLAGPVAGPVRIEAQIEVFYTFPFQLKFTVTCIKKFKAKLKFCLLCSSAENDTLAMRIEVLQNQLKMT